MANIKITTGTYNTKDFRVIKHYSSVKPALKYLQGIGYPYSELMPEFSWNKFGINYTLRVH